MYLIVAIVKLAADWRSNSHPVSLYGYCYLLIEHTDKKTTKKFLCTTTYKRLNNGEDDDYEFHFPVFFQIHRYCHDANVLLPHHTLHHRRHTSTSVVIVVDVVVAVFVASSSVSLLSLLLLLLRFCFPFVWFLTHLPIAYALPHTPSTAMFYHVQVFWICSMFNV